MRNILYTSKQLRASLQQGALRMQPHIFTWHVNNTYFLF